MIYYGSFFFQSLRNHVVHTCCIAVRVINCWTLVHVLALGLSTPRAEVAGTCVAARVTILERAGNVGGYKQKETHFRLVDNM